MSWLGVSFSILIRFFFLLNEETDQPAPQLIMTSSYWQNIPNLEGTLEISCGKGFYQALHLWNVLCQNGH